MGHPTSEPCAQWLQIPASADSLIQSGGHACIPRSDSRIEECVIYCLLLHMKYLIATDAIITHTLTSLSWLHAACMERDSRVKQNAWENFKPVVDRNQKPLQPPLRHLLPPHLMHCSPGFCERGLQMTASKHRAYSHYPIGIPIPKLAVHGSKIYDSIINCSDPT